MRILKYILRFLKEISYFAWHHKAWWILIMFAIMLLLAGLITLEQSVAPFLYTLF
jgi:hypothetical protein